VTLQLQEGFRLLASRRFPARFPSKGLRHRAVVGIGGNIGDVAKRFDRVVDYLQRSGQIHVVQLSPLLRNPPFGFIEQPDFLNAVMVIETGLNPPALMRYLLWVEKRFGRRRSFKNAPRTLDLDIIFYDQLRMKTMRLHLPHPHFHERESVMIPLMFLKGESV